MIAAGVVLAAAGGIGWKVSNSKEASSLTKLTVAPATPGMVATAIGTGGEKPSQVLPGAKHGTGIDGTTDIPTTPLLYLPPATLTQAGVDAGTEPAFWEVWWDGKTQVKATISLQQHLDSSSADAGEAQLVSQNSNPASFQMQQKSAFVLPDVPGSHGYVWTENEGTAKQPLNVELRFASFAAGSRVALVSMETYGKPTSAAAFATFATSEFNKLDGATDPNTALTGQLRDLALVGAALFLVGVVSLAWRMRRRQARQFA